MADRNNVEEDDGDDSPPVARAPRPSFCVTAGRKFARAITDYTAKTDREISFKKGDTIVVVGTGTETDVGFLAGAIKGQFGIFPISAVEMMNSAPQEIPKPTLPPTVSPLPLRAPAPTTPASSSPTPVPQEPAGEKNDKMRAAVLQEIVTTERDYVKDLDTTISVFLIPLRTTGIIPADQINQIFSSLELIVEVNREVLKELEQRIKEGSEADVLIGDIFTKMSNYFKMYVSYCSNQQTCVTVLEKIQQQKHVKAFLDVCHSDPKLKGLQILSFLIKPIQRICKYPLLFKELLKYTPAEHPDFKELALAKQKLDEVTGYVNEGQRYAERLQQVIEIQKLVDGLEITLIAPSRTFVKEGYLKAAIGREKPQARQIYLFSDMLLVARSKLSGAGTANKKALANTKKSSVQYECRAQILLDKAKLVNVSDTPTLQHAFELVTDKKKVVIVCPDENVKNAWLRDVKIILKEFQKKQLLEIRKNAMGQSSPRVGSAIF